MEDRVGSKIPTAIEVSKLVKEIQAIGEKLAPYTISLTPEDRHRALKFRTGGERIVDVIGELATAHEVVLPKISVEAMQADLELAQRLEPLGRAVAVLAQTIADTILEAESECWWATTALYTTLSRLADADPQLKDALRPAVEFFAIGKRTPKPAAPAAATTPPPATPTAAAPVVPTTAQ